MKEQSLPHDRSDTLVVLLHAYTNTPELYIVGPLQLRDLIPDEVERELEGWLSV
jgi:hypothetical protein